jgi:hypothetical protein
VGRFLTGLFGGSQQTQAPVTALRINTSLQGVPLGLLLGGAQRMAGNLIDYYGFTSQQVRSGGGGKGGIASVFKGGPQQTVYTVTFLLGVCEGPNTIDRCWINGAAFGLTTGGAQVVVIPGAQPSSNNSYEIFDGDYNQAPLGATEALDPTHALSYRGLTYVAFVNFSLGNASTLPNITFEVLATDNFSAIQGQPDGHASVAFEAFLTNQYYGIGLPAFRLGSLATWQQYCLALGLVVSPAIASSTQAASFANDLTNATNSAPCWQDGELTVIPYGDAAVTAGQVSQSVETYEVPQGQNQGTVASPLYYPSITVSFASQFAGDGGVTYASGQKFTRVFNYAPTGIQNTGTPQPGSYYVNNGVYYFNVTDINSEVIITYDWAAVASYVPNTTSIYDFTIDDCLPNQVSIGQGVSDPSSPFAVTRKPRDQMLNVINVEYLDRNNSYNPVLITYKDETSIVSFGRERPSEAKQLHFFCLAGAAQQSAVLSLIREQVARKFQWTVGRHFVMILELMALCTITDPGQGLELQPVRIVELQENDDGSYTVTAEEFLGTVSAPEYGTQPSQGAGINYNEDPGSINAPLIFEPTDELGGGNYIWVAASGQNPTIWGGADVWVSTAEDGTYQRVGQVGPARMGVLAADLAPVSVNPGGATIDQVNTLAVNLGESDGALGSGTVLDATTLADPCYVGGEIICFATATLTAPNQYDLDYLVRGAFGTENDIVDHPAGTQFARLDSAIVSFPFQPSQIAQTIYVKFTSFNIFDGGLQSLGDVPAYPYTIQGTALASPLPSVQNLRTVYDVNTGFTEIDWDRIEDFRRVLYEIRVGSSFSAAMLLGRVAQPPFRVPGNGTYWVSGYAQPTPGLTVYSEEWVDVAISGAVLTQNIILTVDLKADGWPGAFTGGAGLDNTLDAIRSGAGNILSDTSILSTADVLDYGGSQSGAYYPGVNAYLDIGYVANASVSIAYQPTGIPVGQNILTVANILGLADFLGAASTVFISVIPQIRFSSTPGGDLYVLGDLYQAQYADLYLETAAEWSAWQSFSPGTYQARFLNFAMQLETADPSTIAYDLEFAITITIPSRVDSYALTTSSSAATTVTFRPTGAAAAAPFNGGPGPGNLPAITWGIVNAQAGDDLVITSLSLSAITFEILNSGSKVVRNLTLFAEGY